MDHKYINPKADGTIIHCPLCRGVVLKYLKMCKGEKEEVVFLIRCPHCQQDLSVRYECASLKETMRIRKLNHKNKESEK